MDESDGRAARGLGLMSRFGDDGGAGGRVAARKVDVGWIVGGEDEDGSFADAGGTCESTVRWVSLREC